MNDSTAKDREFLKQSLRRHGITHEDVATAIDSGRSTVSLWLAGEVSSPALDKAIPAYVAGLERGKLIGVTA